MTFTAPQLSPQMLGEANVRLGRIEAEENVTVLFAVESGSRAWGFPSPDSDNDVRFFYIRPLSQYVGLQTPRDVIERPIDGVWDVNGWDLHKALNLMVAGNATVGEWLKSPLIYRESGPLPYKLRDLVKRYASPEASARHYYGLTSTCYKREVANRPTLEQLHEANERGVKIKGLIEVNQKKYLYAIRGSLSIAWIGRYHEIPPMTMPELMSHDIMPVDVRGEIDRLLEIKRTTGEFMDTKRILCLDTYIEQQIAWAKEHGLDKQQIDQTFAAEANQLLLSTLGVG